MFSIKKYLPVLVASFLLPVSGLSVAQAYPRQYQSQLLAQFGESSNYFQQGVARLKQGDNQGAISAFDNAIRLNPGNMSAYVNRAIARRGVGDLKGALADYDKAIQMSQNDPNLYLNRANTRRDLKDYRGALEVYPIY